MTDETAHRDSPAPTDDRQTVAFSPTPEPRPEWARSAWLDPAGPAVNADHAQPVGHPQTVASGSAPGAAARRGGGMGQVAVAAVLSALLASGGTVALLQST